MADFDPDAYLASKASAPAPAVASPGAFDPDAYLAQRAQAPSLGADLAKSGASGLERAAIGAAGTGGDVRSLIGAAADKLGIPSTVQQVAGTAALAPFMLNPLTAPAALMTRFMPSSSDIQGQVEQATGQPLYEAKTGPGRFVQTAAEFAPGALLGEGGIASRIAKNVLLPATASEAAGEATRGTAAEPYARIGGAVVGGGIGPAIERAGAARAAARVIPTADELTANARGPDGYGNQAVKDLRIQPASVNQLADDIAGSLQGSGYRARNVGDTFGAIDELRGIAADTARQPAAGQPSVFGYHGSATPFTEFSPEKAPYYFTPSAESAAGYARITPEDNLRSMRGEPTIDGASPHIVPAHLEMRNPFQADFANNEQMSQARDAAWLRSHGYDSAVIRDMTDPAATEYVVLDRNQIRSQFSPPPVAASRAAPGADDIDSVRRSLRVTAQGASNPMSPNHAEYGAASRAISMIDDYMANLQPHDLLSGDAQAASRALTSARADYAAAARAERLGEAQYRAENNAGAANSGQNVNNAMRQQLKAILNSPARRRGFSPDEIAQMERIVRGTFVGNAARFMGNLFGGSGLGAVASAGTGFVAGGPAGAVAAPLFGQVARRIGNASTARNIGTLNDMVAMRSPLGAERAAAVRASPQQGLEFWRRLLLSGALAIPASRPQIPQPAQ